MKAGPLFDRPAFLLSFYARNFPSPPEYSLKNHEHQIFKKFLLILLQLKSTVQKIFLNHEKY
jgi:hypothetical protein